MGEDWVCRNSLPPSPIFENDHNAEPWSSYRDLVIFPYLVVRKIYLKLWMISLFYVAHVEPCMSPMTSSISLVLANGPVECFQQNFLLSMLLTWCVPSLLLSIHAQCKLQKARNYKRMGFLQQLHLVIKYKKGSTNNLENMISRPPITKITVLGNLCTGIYLPIMHTKMDTWKIENSRRCFKNWLGQIPIEGDYRDDIIPRMDFSTSYISFVSLKVKLQLIMEANTSKFARHFSVRKTISNIQKYVYKLIMQEYVA